MTKVKGKRVLKNGAIAGYVLQKNGKYVWRIIKGPKRVVGGRPSTRVASNDLQLMAFVGKLIGKLEAKHHMGIRNKTYRDFINGKDGVMGLKEIQKKLFDNDQTTRQAAYLKLCSKMDAIKKKINKSTSKPHFQFWKKKKRKKINEEILAIIGHIDEICRQGHTTTDNNTNKEFSNCTSICYC